MAKMPMTPEKAAKLTPSTIDLIESVVHTSLPRPHLGASIIGHPCARYLVYSFRWTYVNEVNARLKRIFRMGDAVEDIIVKALEEAGIEIYDSQLSPDEETGHAGGSIDGKARCVPEYPGEVLLFEGKSMNHSNFLDMQRKGVKVSKPVHHVQMNTYMGDLGLNHAMYVALDKDTCALYIEFIKFDEDMFEQTRERQQDIFMTRHINEHPKIGANPSWYQCKMCPAKGVCHDGERVHENCRTCDNVQQMTDGEFICVKHDKNLTVEEQQKGCGDWEISELFREVAEATEYYE